MTNAERRDLVESLWDMAAKHCSQGLQAEPTVKELRDYTYVAEHLSEMLNSIEHIETNTIRVVFADGAPQEFNE